MHVAICIVGYRNADDIVRCLEALGQSTHTDFEVQICENGGPEAFRKLIDALPARLPGGQAVAITDAGANLGYAGGVNVCLRATADAGAWWVLNPDTVPDKGALDALLRRLERGGCEIVGGVLYGQDGRVQTLGGRWRPWLARAEAIGKGRSLRELGSIQSVERRIDFVSGASMLISRRFVSAAGFLREDYFLYCEEVEWCLRATAKGMRLGLAADALVLHRQGSTTGSGAALACRPRLQVFLDERNKILVTYDRYPWRIPIAASAALLMIFLRFAARGAFRQTGFAVEGWWAGLIGRRGIPNAI